MLFPFASNANGMETLVLWACAPKTVTAAVASNIVDFSIRFFMVSLFCESPLCGSIGASRDARAAPHGCELPLPRVFSRLGFGEPTFVKHSLSDRIVRLADCFSAAQRT